MALSRRADDRLDVFRRHGLVPDIPSMFQLLLGQLEMAPYVALPDAGDTSRYAGAVLGHPLVRTPVVLTEIGLDHLRVGHGLHARPESVYRHLNFVFHEGIPVFDLQLVQTVPGGLEAFRSYTRAIDEGSTPKARWQRTRIDWILPHAHCYRANFLEEGGWIDRCAAFDYPDEEETADFLRPEFTSLVRFANYCARTFPRRPADITLKELAVLVTDLPTRAVRGVGREVHAA